MPEKVKTHWLFYFGRSLFRVLFKIIWRLEVAGEENIPKSGGVIISPNHRSYADPPLTGSAMKRPLHFMAKEELFRVPVLGFLINRTNAFPVARGTADVGAFKTALNLLAAGEPILVFPEGGRAKGGVEFREPKQGVGMLSCWAQAPVVPARIFNSDRLGGFGRLRIVFGRPVYPPKEFTKETYREVSGKVMAAVKELK